MIRDEVSMDHDPRSFGSDCHEEVEFEVRVPKAFSITIRTSKKLKQREGGMTLKAWRHINIMSF